MNSERFIELTQAYGAAPERWPQGERDIALALLRRDDEQGEHARLALADARWMDDALSTYRVAAPDQALIDRVVLSFHSGPPVQPVRRGVGTWQRPRLWFSGLGLLGAGAVGVASGVMVMSLLVSMSTASSSLSDQVYVQSVFSNSASDWSDE